MELLEQAVEALKRGEQPDVEKPLSGGPELNLRIPALIPEDSCPMCSAASRSTNASPAAKPVRG